MKILIVGGTGVISSAVCHECINKGFELFVINRGLRKSEKMSETVQIRADIRKELLSEIRNKIGVSYFDIVIDFLSYNVKQLKKTTQLVKCSQYIFISSATVYEENNTHIYTENSKKGNFGWNYCKNKYECENELTHIAASFGFKYTIVRPYITYSEERFPYQISPVEYYTIVYRIINSLPIPICGINNRTTVTNSKDFAKGIVGLIGNMKAYNEDFHITSDNVVKWRDIADLLASRFGTECNYIDIPQSFLKDFWNTTIDIQEILYDKAREMKFDNTKLLDAVPDFMPENTIHESITDISKFFSKNVEYRFNYLWTGNIDRIIRAYSGVKVDTKAYKFNNMKERVLYGIGRNSFLCILYNLARKIRNIV